LLTPRPRPVLLGNGHRTVFTFAETVASRVVHVTEVGDAAAARPRDGAGDESVARPRGDVELLASRQVRDADWRGDGAPPGRASAAALALAPRWHRALDGGADGRGRLRIGGDPGVEHGLMGCAPAHTPSSRDAVTSRSRRNAQLAESAYVTVLVRLPGHAGRHDRRLDPPGWPEILIRLLLNVSGKPPGARPAGAESTPFGRIIMAWRKRCAAFPGPRRAESACTPDPAPRRVSHDVQLPRMSPLRLQQSR